MNILYITHCDPRDTDFGSAQRSHLLWQSLKKIGTVYTLYAVGRNVPDVDVSEERIRSFCFAPQDDFALAVYLVWNKLFRPTECPFRLSNEMLQRMPWRNVRFDAVVVRYLYGVARSQAWKIAPTYVDVDDLPIEAYNTVYRKQRLPGIGLIGSCLVRWWQGYLLRKCAGAWIASANQVGEISRYCPSRALMNLALPPRADYQVNGRQKRQLMTVGLMSYAPNYEGVDWFVENVWPLVYERFMDMKYLVCGGGLPNRLKDKWSRVPGVSVLGFVQDLDEVYENSIGVVTPILSGAGTCIKVVESALRGRKTFATQFAVRGLVDDEVKRLGIAVSENAATMRDQILRWIDASDKASEQEEISQMCKCFNSVDAFERSVRDAIRKDRK